MRPVLAAAAEAGQVRPDVDAYELMRAVGNLCAGVGHDSHYDAHQMVEVLIAGLGRSKTTIRTQPDSGKGRRDTK